MNPDWTIFERSKYGRSRCNLKALECSSEVTLSCRHWQSRALLEALAITDDLPVLRGNDTRLVGCLQIWLVEARKDDVAVVWLQLSVHILCAILIAKVLTTLAVCDIECLKFDHYLILTDSLLYSRYVDSVIEPQIFSLLFHLLSIDSD